MRPSLVGAVAVAALAAPAAAGAHVTVNPTTVPAEAYTVLTVRVPNERDDASTRRVVLQLPPGFVAVAHQPVDGWSVRVRHRELGTPIETPDGPITRVVGTIAWTADDRDAAIGPGQFRDFAISTQIPGEPGDTLTFKALQAYTGGEVVRWIGGPDAAEPAATVAVVAPSGDEQGSHAPAGASADPADPDGATAIVADGSANDGDGGGDGLAVAALVVGGLALLTGIAALLRSRGRPSAA